MTYIEKPRLHHKALPTNKIGFTRRDYEGRISTLCAGCGHDSISAALIPHSLELLITPGVGRVAERGESRFRRYFYIVDTIVDRESAFGIVRIQMEQRAMPSEVDG